MMSIITDATIKNVISSSPKYIYTLFKYHTWDLAIFVLHGL